MTDEELLALQEELKRLKDENAKLILDLKEKDKDNNLSADDKFKKAVADAVAEQIKDIKGKLDKSFEQRDEALKKVAEFEKEKKEKEIADLKEQGKHKEAFEKELAEIKANNEVLNRRNIELTRDIDVRSALTKLNFRSETAQEMAFKEIVKDLVQDDKGQWLHKSGSSIKDYIKAFGEDEDKAFLFKVATSSGSGGGGAGGSKGPSSNEKKSLFAMDQKEVLKLASEGKLTRRK